MNLEELKEMLEEIAPDCRIVFDKKRQIIIQTGLAEDVDGELVSVDDIDEGYFEGEDEDEEDEDFNSEFDLGDE